MKRSRLMGALAGYALIALSATSTLEEKFRYAVWVLMGGLALKSWVAAQKLCAEHSAEATESRGANEVDAHKEDNRERQ
jgi:hypothetical protein